MAYTTIDDPSAYFQIATYTGNGTDNTAITYDGNSDMQPDFLWFKLRSTTGNHVLLDSSKGSSKYLRSNNTAAESTSDTLLKSFDSDGFTVGDSASTNYNTYTLASWGWKANGGTTTSNSDGSVTSTVQVNSDAGFSIQTLTSASSGTSNWGHGLGQKPDWWVVKITGSGGGGWWLHHKGLTSGTSSQYLGLNLTQAATNLSAFDASSSTITASADFVANSKTMVCYAFVEKQGYSKFGSYVGNGSSNGTFVYTGFAPAWIMLKDASQATNWEMFDVKRNTFNVRNLKLGANLAVAENGSDLGTTSQNNIDILSNGFKMRTGNTDTNVSGDTYIYMAFAENPFVTSTGIPTTAR